MGKIVEVGIPLVVAVALGTELATHGPQPHVDTEAVEYLHVRNQQEIVASGVMIAEYPAFPMARRATRVYAPDDSN